MTMPEITTRGQEVVTLAGRIELRRDELDYIISQGAYIVAYRRIYRPYRTTSGAYRILDALRITADAFYSMAGR